MENKEQFAILSIKDGDEPQVLQWEDKKVYSSVEEAEKVLLALPEQYKGKYAIYRRTVTPWEKVENVYTSPEVVHSEGRTGGGRASKGG